MSDYKIPKLKVKPGVPVTLKDGDNPTFDEWEARVNKWLIQYRGLDLHDLPDMPYRDWYDRRMRPIHAANKVISSFNRENGGS